MVADTWPHDVRVAFDDTGVDGTGFDGTGFDETGLGDGPLDESGPSDLPFGATPFRDVQLADLDLSGRGVSRPAVGPLGCALRVARRQRFLSQAELAKSAGVHQTQVSKLELGAPNWALFCKLIETLGGEPVVTVKPLDPDKEMWDRLRASIW